MRLARSGHSRAAGGFSLIELIFTAGMIGIFALLAVPIWKQSAEEARGRICQSNLAQLGRGVALYAAEHNEMLPGNQHSQPSWIRSLQAYCHTNAYRCPEEISAQRTITTVALNDFLSRRPYGARELDFAKRTSIPVPQETLLFAEADQAYRAYDHFHFADSKENGYGVEAFAEQVDVERHSGAANYLFVDGHVGVLAWSAEVKPRLKQPGSRFVHPTGSMGLELARK